LKRIFSSKPVIKNRSTIFTIGMRAQVINEDLEAPVLVPHAQQKADKKYPFESIFRSEQYALLDNACREYLFLCDFFMIHDKFASEMFFHIFGKTLSYLHKNIETAMNTCYDAIAIFLGIHIIYRYQVIAMKRNCGILNGFYETILAVLWSRFEIIMRNHINSITVIDTQKFHSLDVRPHYITRRYAEFSSALSSINESFPNEKLTYFLNQLQNEVQDFIFKLASEFNHRKEQLILQINNFDLILSLLTERLKEDSNEAAGVKQRLKDSIDEYVEVILNPYFGNLIQFVKETELIIEKGNVDSLKTFEASAAQIIRTFGNDWRKSYELINQEIMRTFTNFKNGQAILQASLTQLLQYYRRFQNVLSHNSFRNLNAKSEMLSIHHLMVEIKKHKPTF